METVRIADLGGLSACSISGKVIRTFEARGSFIATIIDDSGKLDVANASPFTLGSFVKASGNLSRRGRSLELQAETIEPLVQEQEELAKRIERFLEEKSTPEERPMLIQDGVMKNLWPKVLECARRLKEACFLERPILLRHHGDADGISGAIAIYRGVGALGGRLFSNQNPHATYDMPDALRDINTVRSLSESTEGPVLLLIDMGSGPDSSDALSVAKGAGFEIIIIDHHPLSSPVSESADVILSPMLAGATSYYTAGLLAGEVANALGGPDPSELQRISLAGDKSGLVPSDPLFMKKALALDYIGKYSRFQSTLEFYSSVLSDERMLVSIQNQATAKLESATRLAKESIKIKELPNGFRLCTANLQKAFRPGSFPSKGMLCGVIHDQVRSEMSGPLVTIGYSGRLISIRANLEARERGFDANALINEVRRELVNSIESGGGHDVAASVHVSEGFENIVLEEIVRHISSL